MVYSNHVGAINLKSNLGLQLLSGRAVCLGCRNTDAFKPTVLYIVNVLVDICISTHLSLKTQKKSSGFHFSIVSVLVDTINTSLGEIMPANVSPHEIELYQNIM